MTAMDVLHVVTAAMAVVAGLLALVRIGLGPTLLDRVVANDVLTASGVGLVAIMIVWWSRADLGVLLILLALTAFIASVVVSRFAVREDARSRRILTPEEAERQRLDRERAAREADEAEVREAARIAAEEAAGTGDEDGAGSGPGPEGRGPDGERTGEGSGPAGPGADAGTGATEEEQT